MIWLPVFCTGLAFAVFGGLSFVQAGAGNGHEPVYWGFAGLVAAIAWGCWLVS